MASGTLKVYSLGLTGVILDRDPINPTLPDGALIRAQNATHDPTAQRDGGALRKRPGLKRFNIVTASGAILGGMTMAVAGTGGAPAVLANSGVTGGGADTGGGSGDGTGAPGGTVDGGLPTFGTVGAALFGGNNLFSKQRLIIIGYDDNSGSGDIGEGWYVTSKGIANTVVKVTTPGPPNTLYQYPPTTLFPYCVGTPGVFHPDSGFYFYAHQHDQVNGGVPTIRKTNGAIDVLVATVLYNQSAFAFSSVANVSTGVIHMAITSMILGADGNIHIGIKDRAMGQSTVVTSPVIDQNVGRLAQLDPITNAYTDGGRPTKTIVANAVHSGIPYSLAFFQNSLWWGEFNLNASSELVIDTNAVIWVTNNVGVATLEHGFSDGEAATTLYAFPQSAPSTNPSMNVLANQVLFAGFAVHKTVSTQAIIYKRDRSAPSTSTAYTASLVSTSTPGTLGSNNHFSSMVAFKDNLYAAYYSGNAFKIYKFVPTYTNLAADGFWDGTGTWSTAYSIVSNFPHTLHVDQDTIYALGSNADAIGNSIVHVLTSTDGATWTDKSANVPGSVHTFPLPMLFGLDQQ